MAYRISTGERWVLNEEDGLVDLTAGKKYFLWDTYLYRSPDDGLGPNARDIVAYDPVTDTKRRLTTRAYPWGVGMSQTTNKWAHFPATGSPAPHGVYLVNLQAYGILDQDGNLIPGDPVIDPPTQ